MHTAKPVFSFHKQDTLKIISFFLFLRKSVQLGFLKELDFY
ncbi:hypothetical protein D920_02369 [Enterococcus faecalis 13-SD-W-01]|nr:hypothetical protein D920_02369 [Enterococcus faecalis 13-SD-W-01]